MMHLKEHLQQLLTSTLQSGSSHEASESSNLLIPGSLYEGTTTIIPVCLSGASLIISGNKALSSS